MIWVVEELAGFGGIEHMVALHAAEMARAGVPITLVARPPIHPVWRTRLKDAGLRLVEADDESPAALCRCTLRVAHEAAARAILFVPLGEGCEHWLHLGERPPIWTTAWEMTDMSARCWWLPERLSEWIHRLDMLLVVSDSARREAVERFGFRAPVRVVPGGVYAPNPGVSPRAPDSSPLVTCISRLSQEKGLEYAIAALALLPRSLDGVRLDVWGDGIDRTRLLTQLRLFGVEDCVSLQGTFAPGDQLDDIASRTTVFLLPSLIEGRPIALMEMAVRGVPTVATETTGAVEILGADYPWLVPVGDTHALASALRDLLVQPDSWCRAVEWVLRASRPFVVTAGRSSPVLECHRHLYGMEVAR